jgi:hypothetical protein
VQILQVYAYLTLCDSACVQEVLLQVSSQILVRKLFLSHASTVIQLPNTLARLEAAAVPANDH